LIPHLIHLNVSSAPEELSYFHGIVERNPDMLSQIWKDVAPRANDDKAHDGITTGRAYLLENTDRIPENERLRFVHDTFQKMIPSQAEIDQRTSKDLSFAERKAFEKNTLLFKQELSKLSAEEQQREIQSYWQLASSRDSLSLMLSALPQPAYDYSSYSREKFEKEPLYANNAIASQAHNMVDLMLSSKTQRLRNSYATSSVIKVSTHYLLLDPSKSKAKELVNVLLTDLETAGSSPDAANPTDVLDWIRDFLGSSTGAKFVVGDPELISRLEALLIQREALALRPEKFSLERIRERIETARNSLTTP
jgi:hypothetical protein